MKQLFLVAAIIFIAVSVKAQVPPVRSSDPSAVRQENFTPASVKTQLAPVKTSDASSLRQANTTAVSLPLRTSDNASKTNTGTESQAKTLPIRTTNPSNDALPVNSNQKTLASPKMVVPSDTAASAVKVNKL